MNYISQPLQCYGNMLRRMILPFSFLIIYCSFAHAQKKQEVEFVGTVQFFQIGSCTASEEPLDVKLVIGVNSKNKALLTVEEFRKDENGLFKQNELSQWSGEILNDVCLRLQAVADITCGEEKRTEILHFIGMIDCPEEGSPCTMKLEDTFAMCPANNCIFSVEYDLKTDSIER